MSSDEKESLRRGRRKVVAVGEHKTSLASVHWRDDAAEVICARKIAQGNLREKICLIKLSQPKAMCYRENLRKEICSRKLLWANLLVEIVARTFAQ